MKNWTLIPIILFSLNGCFTKEVTIPKENLRQSLDIPVYSDSQEIDEYFIPVFTEIKRPQNDGNVYQAILKEKETGKIVRTIAILVDDKTLNLKPEEYIHYPIYYASSVSRKFRFWPYYKSTYDIRRASDNSPVYMPVYASAGIASLAAFGIAYVASTGTAFIVGLGKGTYEFTEDILEGVVVSNQEIVLAYNDYLYDNKNRLTSIMTYLPYRSISKSVIPLYDREGKKQIGQMYPSSKPILISQLDYKYNKINANPSSVTMIEYLPKKMKKTISLPVRNSIK
ncbi:hypothetical protein [Leptospira limi]|uniref:Lipoprotein n=1 Tax=Leptospira limi TaxID=2950023 RepID=A0ABT3LVR7_9LEPT|nr:hypothetical protein [Leptospira limi]MCW7461585.1 hypothetical protein [Leptospira limi]